MNKSASLLILFLFACGPSPEKIAEQEKRRSDLATVTCNLMGESKDADAAIRIKEINSAREKLGEDFYIGTDAGIRESFVYGLCKELVLNDPDYNSKLLETITAAKEAEEKARMASEKLAEERRVLRKIWSAKCVSLKSNWKMRSWRTMC